jgi:succinate dehydrogenase / fumarate reductase flavoprotein subunit
LGSFHCIISSLIFNYNGIRFKNSSWSNSRKWTNYKDHINLVNPANKRNIDMIVGGLAGISCNSWIRYNVKSLSRFTSSQLYCCTRGNYAAKNYQMRQLPLRYCKRRRLPLERSQDLAEVSVNNDQVVQGVPLARDTVDHLITTRE